MELPTELAVKKMTESIYFFEDTEDLQGYAMERIEPGRDHFGTNHCSKLSVINRIALNLLLNDKTKKLSIKRKCCRRMTA